uniref:Uncharacterized protein n=1 Tax=Hordeum vulgare subsp. vulgare TaxID=112509 RepID=A0A8I6XEL9_HORVV
MSTAAATAALTSSPFARRPRAARGGRRTVRLRACVFHPEVARAVESLQTEFREVDGAIALNSSRVSAAFRAARVAPHHFGGSTGYGHDDAGGREALDSVFARVVGAEAAIVRPQFFSGTHAIACALFALLRPGHELLAVAGPPYDTLEEVIGIRGSANVGSLRDFGVTYREVPLGADGGLDWDALAHAVRPETGCALIQRSCGYSWRKSLGVDDIRKAIDLIKMQNPNCKVMVDNCYGEFVETSEPPMVGADLIAGSLIKNPGGTIAPCGGYIAGKKDLVAAAAARLSAPGLGVEFGSAPGHVMRAMFQGLFLAPQMVGEAVKGGLLIAEVMSAKGYRVQPLPRAPRHDIVQVIFADGTFMDGSTSELSCDGPLRDPYAVFCQGGTHWTQWALVLSEVLKVM